MHWDSPPSEYKFLIECAKKEVETYKRHRDYPEQSPGCSPIPRHSKKPQERGNSTVYLLEKEMGYRKVGRFFTHGSLSGRKEKLGCDLHVHMHLDGLIVRVRYIGTPLPCSGLPKDAYGYPNAVTDVEVATTHDLSILETLDELKNTPERAEWYRKAFKEKEPWLMNFLGVRAYNPEHRELVNKVMALFKLGSRDKRSFQALEEAVDHWLELQMRCVE